MKIGRLKPPNREGHKLPHRLAITPTPQPQTSSGSGGPFASWVAVQRSFGPLFVRQIGLAWADSAEVSLLVDAAITLEDLSITLTGLEAAVALQPPGLESFSLQGLEISYQGGLSVAGGLLQTDASPLTYSGNVLLSAGDFTIVGIGLFADGNPPSISGFFFLSAPLGGPPFFFVTGLAGGFGYNTSLNLPSISGVSSFALVEGAMGTLDATQTQARLDAAIQPEANQNWLALGVRFTSFELLESFALLTVAVGTQLELAILGESVLTFPPTADSESTSPPIAQAQLALEATLQPDSGQLAVNAQLSPGSYVFDPAAQLTGGFAYYQWFGDNAHSGDFVVTLGGYNPYWTAPPHYPTVPALGLNWTLSTEMSMKGSLYFALTPSMIMAGTSLSAVWKSGGIAAWFDADTDFLIRFQPFQYGIDLSVSIGVSYTLTIIVTKTFTVQVGVDVQFWGPPFGGVATVDLAVISFTLSFGQPQDAPPPVTWASFRGSFLPAPAAQAPQPHFSPLAAVGSLAVMPPAPPAPSSLLSISAAQGLVATSGNFLQLDPLSFVLSIGTQVPSTNATVNDTPVPGTFALIGVGPMGLTAGTVTSTLTVFVQQWDGSNWIADDQPWTPTAVTGSVPAALWSNTSGSLGNPSLVENALTGLTVVPAPVATQQTLPVPVSSLVVGPGQTLAAALAGAPVADWSGAYTSVWEEVQTTAVTPLVLPQSAVLASLAMQGLSTLPTSVDLSSFVAEAASIFTAAPVLAALGATQ